MGQKLTGRTLPSAGRNAMIDMSQHESTLILIKHCRDMKQQEARFRLITLCLLLSCTALFCFSIISDLRERGNSEAGRQGSAAEQTPNYYKQDRLCTAKHDDGQNEAQKLHIDHKFVWENNVTDKVFIKWVPMLDNGLEETHAIVIPKSGFYFIYVRFLLTCHGGGGDKVNKFHRFFGELIVKSEGYNKDRTLTVALDGVMCPSEGYRTVFVGQLFDLFEGDHVKVWIEDGYNLISTASFGAFLQ